MKPLVILYLIFVSHISPVRHEYVVSMQAFDSLQDCLLARSGGAQISLVEEYLDFHAGYCVELSRDAVPGAVRAE